MHFSGENRKGLPLKGLHKKHCSSSHVLHGCRMLWGLALYISPFSLCARYPDDFCFLSDPSPGFAFLFCSYLFRLLIFEAFWDLDPRALLIRSEHNSCRWFSVRRNVQAQNEATAVLCLKDPMNSKNMGRKDDLRAGSKNILWKL